MWIARFGEIMGKAAKKKTETQPAISKNAGGSLCLEPILSRSIPINDLNSAEFLLIGPIQIEIEIYPEEIIAKVPELDLWASSSTESEALLDIKSAIIELWDELENENDSKLGKLPRMWKRILKRKIISHVSI